jgi:hypothetical protein
MATLSAWECGSYLYGPQNLEVRLHQTRLEHETTKVAHVIADVLSRKAHCNYLPVVRLTREESDTRVLPNLSLFNITLTPILRDEIIAA